MSSFFGTLAQWGIILMVVFTCLSILFSKKNPTTNRIRIFLIGCTVICILVGVPSAFMYSFATNRELDQTISTTCGVQLVEKTCIDAIPVGNRGSKCLVWQVVGKDGKGREVIMSFDAVKGTCQ